jgi:hypothetical protein
MLLFYSLDADEPVKQQHVRRGVPFFCPHVPARFPGSGETTCPPGNPPVTRSVSEESGGLSSLMLRVTTARLRSRPIVPEGDLDWTCTVPDWVHQAHGQPLLVNPQWREVERRVTSARTRLERAQVKYAQLILKAKSQEAAATESVQGPFARSLGSGSGAPRLGAEAVYRYGQAGCV